MIGARDAFLFGFHAAVAATAPIRNAVVDAVAASDPSNAELARTAVFAHKAIAALALTSTVSAKQLADLATRNQRALGPMPTGVEPILAWLAATTTAIGESQVAFRAGEAVGALFLGLSALRDLAYLRLGAPNTAAIAAWIERFEAANASARARLEALAIQGAGPAIAALDATPDLATVTDATALAKLNAWIDGTTQKLAAINAAFENAEAPMTAPPTAEEQRLLAEILAHPLDDAPRVLFARLAATRRDPRATLIDTQLAIRDLRKTGYTMTAREADLTRRAAALIKAHPEWSDDAIRAGARAARFHRGFVDEITIDLARFLSSAPQLYAVAPIVHLELAGVGGHGAALAASPHLARIVSLDLDENGVTDADIAALAASPNARSLRWLDLARNAITDAAVDTLAASPNLRGLVYCGLQPNRVDDPTDAKYFLTETQFDWMPTERGKALEVAHGRIAWLHPRTEVWPPNLDQI